MNVLTAPTIDKLINILNYKDAEADKLDDANLRNYLKYVNILDSEKSKILEANNKYDVEDLYYSKYYWFIKFKNRYFDIYGHDEGLEQQAFRMLEDIGVYFKNGINWTIIESIDNDTIL